MYKNAFQALELLQPYFKSSEGISPTSLRSGILTGFAVEFFFLRFPQLKKAKDSYWQACTRATFMCPWQRIPFFGSRVAVFTSNPSCLKYWLLHFFILQGSHVQRQYRKRTTLCSESSTIKGLLYTPEPHNCKKRTLSDQPQLWRGSSTALLCCWGCSCSKIWCPSWLTLRHMPYGRGRLKIPLQRIL